MQHETVSSPQFSKDEMFYVLLGSMWVPPFLHILCIYIHSKLC